MFSRATYAGASFPRQPQARDEQRTQPCFFHRVEGFMATEE